MRRGVITHLPPPLLYNCLTGVRYLITDVTAYYPPQIIPSTHLCIKRVVEDALKAPGRVAELGGGQAVLLQVDGEDGELAGGQLAAVLVSRGGEQHAQPRLVVDGAAGGIVPVVQRIPCSSLGIIGYIYGGRSPKFYLASMSRDVHSCTYSLGETPQLPPSPAFGLAYEGGIGQQR